MTAMRYPEKKLGLPSKEPGRPPKELIQEFGSVPETRAIPYHTGKTHPSIMNL